uniref:SOCS box domain-containing protein n=1 Tax=Biomphalaria glabrata TaxID=6526 RepID=A0A2C9K8K5_BIOGL
MNQDNTSNSDNLNPQPSHVSIGSSVRRNVDASGKAGFERREKRRNIRLLQKAIMDRDIEMIKSILSSEFEIDFQYSSQTSLQLAVCQGYADICSLLIAKGANVNQADAGGNSLLNMACWRGFSDVVQLLVDHGADLDLQNESGNSALNACAVKGFKEIAEILILAKCSLNLANNKGFTPLYNVSQSGNISMVQQLLKAGADPDWGDYTFKTPLMVAVEAGHVDVVKALLQAGADVNKKSRSGRTAAYEAASVGHEEIMKVLIEYHADLNNSTVKGFTPLLEAISSNHTKVAKILISSGCEVNLADRKQWAPLHAVIRQVSMMFDPEENSEMRSLVEEMVKAGADVNKMDGENWTPLYQAASAGDFEMCKFLLANGASVNLVTKKGSSVLHAAVYGGNKDIVKLCLDAGCSVNAVDINGQHALLASVASRCNLEIIELLLEAGSDVNIRNTITKQTALHEAICQHYSLAAHLLIDKGSNLDALNSEHKSPLYLACWRGLTEIVSYMLSKSGCSTSCIYPNALPIHAAATQGRAGIIQLLAEHGCDINQMNEKGETPIMAALGEDSQTAVRALLQCGCDLELQYKLKCPQICCILHEDPHPHLGIEPLFLAMTHKNLDTMKMLLQNYRVVPYKTIRILELLLKRTQGINTHYTQKQKQDIMDLFHFYTHNPFTLTDACRRCIRSSLGSPIHHKVVVLPVAEKVKEYILMRTEFDGWIELEQDLPGGSSGFSDIFRSKSPV